MATKHTIDRLYIFSNNAQSPTARAAVTDTLFFLAHGYFKRPGKMTKVTGVAELRFACQHSKTTDPEEIINAIKTSDFSDFDNSNGLRYLANANVQDYTFQKELDDKAKSDFKDKDSNEYQFVNATFIQKVYPARATFDLACMHNPKSSVRTMLLSDVFKTINDKFAGKYRQILIGSCREEEA